MNEYEAIRQIIANATRYDKTYMGKVLQDLDPEGKGRVLISIPDLGILTPAEGVWADVEQPIGANVSPRAEDWVAVYFLAGDPSKPCVRGRTSIVKDNLPKNANRKQVFYEDDNTKIYYDESNQEITIDTAYKVNVVCGDTTIQAGSASVTCDGDITIEGGNIEISGDKLTALGHLEIAG